MENKTDNELISEFMGYKKSGIHPAFGQLYSHYEESGFSTLDQFKYDTSWDWLMPVLVRWDAVLIPNDKQEYFRRSQLLEDAVTNNYDITEAYEQLVDNLKWYNDNKWVDNHGK